MFRKKFEAHLHKVLFPYQSNSSFASSIEYVLFANGKRLRPLLIMAIASDFGEPLESVLTYAVAVELLHVSSLLHDDLPALDNDDLRRGVPSCHRKFDEPTAILLGDYLPALASYLVASEENQKSDTTQYVLRILNRSFMELCEGQLREFQEETAGRTYEEIVSLKTSALFRASCLFGGVGQIHRDAAFEKYLSDMGTSFGVLFQLLDDRIDNDLSKDEELLPMREKHLTQFTDSLRAIEELSRTKMLMTRELFNFVVDSLEI